MKIFWAWQSDLPGKISRHFIRDALESAIKKLKQAPDIEEPDEKTRRDDLYLDSDRKGVSGSPDLARIILNKIEASAVFVCDVTPVGNAKGMSTDSGTRNGKPLTNPNVAIELGYAMAKLGDEKILMILNTAYGNREGLPFDIRHKAGPILYELAESATKQQVENEKFKLTHRLCEAILPFLSAIEPTSTNKFNENPSKIGSALFFGEGETLARSSRGSVEYSMPSRSVFYLRVIPTRELDMPLAIGTLKKKCFNLWSFQQC